MSHKAVREAAQKRVAGKEGGIFQNLSEIFAKIRPLSHGF